MPCLRARRSVTRTVDQAPQTLRRHRHTVGSNAHSVVDRVTDRGGRRIERGLSNALGSERTIRIVRLNELDANLRNVLETRNTVVQEIGIEHFTVSNQHLLGQGRCDALGHATVHLARRRRRVDDRTAVVHRPIIDDAYGSRLYVDLDLGDVRAEDVRRGQVAVFTVIGNFGGRGKIPLTDQERASVSRRVFRSQFSERKATLLRIMVQGPSVVEPDSFGGYLQYLRCELRHLGPRVLSGELDGLADDCGATRPERPDPLGTDESIDRDRSNLGRIESQDLGDDLGENGIHPLPDVGVTGNEIHMAVKPEPDLGRRSVELVDDDPVDVLMVEQNAYAALELCDRAYLLESGTVTLHGTGDELLNNPHVKQAYLGG